MFQAPWLYRWIQVDADTDLTVARTAAVVTDDGGDPEPVAGKGLLQGALHRRAAVQGLGGKGCRSLLPGGGHHAGHPVFQL